VSSDTEVRTPQCIEPLPLRRKLASLTEQVMRDGDRVVLRNLQGQIRFVMIPTKARTFRVFEPSDGAYEDNGEARFEGGSFIIRYHDVDFMHGVRPNR